MFLISRISLLTTEHYKGRNQIKRLECSFGCYHWANNLSSQLVSVILVEGEKRYLSISLLTATPRKQGEIFYLNILFRAGGEIFQFNILLEVHVRPGGHTTRGLHCHWLGPGPVSFPGQSGNLYLVSGIWLQSGHIIGGHIWIASIEPQRLTVVLVETLLNIPLIELLAGLGC